MMTSQQTAPVDQAGVLRWAAEPGGCWPCEAPASCTSKASNPGRSSQDDVGQRAPHAELALGGPVADPVDGHGAGADRAPCTVAVSRARMTCDREPVRAALDREAAAMSETSRVVNSRPTAAGRGCRKHRYRSGYVRRRSRRRRGRRPRAVTSGLGCSVTGQEGGNRRTPRWPATDNLGLEEGRGGRCLNVCR